MVAGSYNKELAKLVHKSARAWVRRFELPRWPLFFVEQKELPNDNARHPESAASIRVEESANEVYIWYLGTLAPAAVDRIMAHELGHWVTADLWEFLNSVLDDKDYKEARRLIEHIIETYTIALVQPDRSWPFDPEEVA